MAQTAFGAKKYAARRIGISLDEYLARTESGLKWCTRGKHWRHVSEYSADSSRYDGLGTKCLECRLSHKCGLPPLPTRKLMGAMGLGWCAGCSAWVADCDRVNGRCRACENLAIRRRYACNWRLRKRIQQVVIARKRGIDPIPVDLQESLTEEFEGKCAYCGKYANSWDHIIPITKGGTSVAWNIVPCCIPCNSSKSNHHVFDWIDRKPHLKPCAEVMERLVMFYQ